jgi:hypothetical protein
MPNHEKSKQHVPFIERGVVPAIVLTVICAACVALLAVTATITADARAKQEQLMADANKRTLFPEADDFPEELITEAGKSFPANTSIDLTIDHPAVDQVFVVKQGDEVIGAIVRASSKGYAGQLPVMVGFNLKDWMKGERHTFSAEEWCADNAEDILFVIRLFRVCRRYDNGMMSLPIQAPFKQRCRR